MLLAGMLAGGLVAATAPGAGADAPPVAQDQLVSPEPTDRTPHVQNGAVLAAVQVGDRIVLGGTFTTASDPDDPDGTQAVPRKGLLAFDVDTGELVAGFDPEVQGKVKAMAPAPGGNAVIIGGAFQAVDGQPARNVAKIDVSTGELVPAFEPPRADQLVDDVEVQGGRLFVGGHFTRFGTTTRTGLAELDPTTGAVLPTLRLDITNVGRPGDSLVYKLAVSPDGDTMVAIGRFTTVGGEPRRQVAMLDLSGAEVEVLPWRTREYEGVCAPKFDFWVRDVEFAPNGAYFVVVSTGAYGGGPPALCDTAARYETAARGLDVRPTWLDYTGGDSLYAVAVTGTAVYVGGHQRYLNNPFGNDKRAAGAVSREGVAALDPVNGLPLSWNPGRTRGHGVQELLATTEGLYMGSDTERTSGVVRKRIAMFPLAGGTVVPQPERPVLPGDTYLLGPRGEGDRAIDRRRLDSDGAGRATRLRGDVSWPGVRAATLVGNRLYVARSDGSLTRRRFVNGQTGPVETIPLNGLTQLRAALSEATSMFYDRGRLYYTRAGRDVLYQRYLTVESDVVGAQQFVVDEGGSGVDWTRVGGAFLAGKRLLWADRSTGALRSTRWGAGGPVPGTTRTVSGPGVDGASWRGRALVYAQERPNTAPTADFARRCDGLQCTFDGSRSTDADGQIVSYDWDFGDGTGASGAAAVRQKAYAEDGTYPVTLTVEDDRGATAQVTKQVEVSGQESPIAFVGSASTVAAASQRTYTVQVPAGVQAGDRLVLAFTLNAPGKQVTGPGPGWAGLEDVTSAVGGVRVLSWTRAAPAAGGQVTVSVPDPVRGHLALLAYRGVDAADPVVAADAVGSSTPTDRLVTPEVDVGAPRAWVVSGWAAKSTANDDWVGPGDQAQRVEFVGTGSGHVDVLEADSGAAVPTGDAGGLVAETSAEVPHSVTWTLALRAAD